MAVVIALLDLNVNVLSPVNPEPVCPQLAAPAGMQLLQTDLVVMSMRLLLLFSCCCLYYHEHRGLMQGGEAGLAAALLQSLRWRLDKAATASDRCQVLASYIEHDLLMLRQVQTPSLSNPPC